MTVKVSKPPINLREELSALNKPTGIAGEAMLRAETPQEQFNLIGAGRRNLIINGDMRVAQRGTTSTVTNYQTVDRWRTGFSGVSLTQSQETVATGDAPFKHGFRKFLRLTQTGSGTAAADVAQIAHRIEGLTAGASGWDCTSGGSHITVSAWVRSSLAGTYYLYLQTRGSTSGYINMPFTVSANVWTKVEFVISGNSGCFIDYDNTTGIECRFVPYYGTNYTGGSVPSSSWYFDVSGGEVPDFEQNWCAVSGATFDITGIQLELGKVATPFEHRSYGEELALCQRYYYAFQVAGPISASENTFMATAYSANSLYAAIQFPVPMRALPSIISGGAWAVRHGNNFQFTANFTYQRDGVNVGFISMGLPSGSGVNTGDAYWVEPSGSTDPNTAYLAFDAEI